MQFLVKYISKYQIYIYLAILRYNRVCCGNKTDRPKVIISDLKSSSHFSTYCFFNDCLIVQRDAIIASSISSAHVIMKIFCRTDVWYSNFVLLHQYHLLLSTDFRFCTLISRPTAKTPLIHGLYFIYS